MCLCDVCCSASIECHLCYPGTVFLFFVFLFALSTCFVFFCCLLLFRLWCIAAAAAAAVSDLIEPAAAALPNSLRLSGILDTDIYTCELRCRLAFRQTNLISAFSTQHCRTRHFNYVDRRTRRSGPLGAGNAVCDVLLLRQQQQQLRQHFTLYYKPGYYYSICNRLHAIAIAVGLNFTLLPHSALFGPCLPLFVGLFFFFFFFLFLVGDAILKIDNFSV